MVNSFAARVSALLTGQSPQNVEIIEGEFKRAVVRTADSLKLLGCELCLGRELDDTLMIGGREALPITAFSEENGPLAGAIFVCPECGRMLIHPEIRKLPLSTKVSPLTTGDGSGRMNPEDGNREEGEFDHE
jgi:hypothetical protein